MLSIHYLGVSLAEFLNLGLMLADPIRGQD